MRLTFVVLSEMSQQLLSVMTFGSDVHIPLEINCNGS